jgi:hypothetical protein
MSDEGMMMPLSWPAFRMLTRIDCPATTPNKPVRKGWGWTPAHATDAGRHAKRQAAADARVKTSRMVVTMSMMDVLLCARGSTRAGAL